MQNTLLSERLQSDLNVRQEWDKRWDMEFNPSKCQVLHITRSRNPIRYNYTMHGQTLESVENSGIREAAYKTIGRPQLEYASTTWNSYTKKTYTRLRWCRGGRSVGYVILTQIMTVLLLCSHLRSQITGAEAGDQVSSCFLKQYMAS